MRNGRRVLTARPAVVIFAVGTFAVLGAASVVAQSAASEKPAEKPAASEKPAPPTDYAVLVSRLPGSLRDGCSEMGAAENELIAAFCPPGIYKLWRSEADLKAGFSMPAVRKGSCATPPPPAGRVEEQPDRPGRLACRLYDERSGAHHDHYVIEWALDDRLVTAGFSADDADPAKYRQFYDEALAAFRAMP